MVLCTHDNATSYVALKAVINPMGIEAHNLWAFGPDCGRGCFEGPARLIRLTRRSGLARDESRLVYRRFFAGAAHANARDVGTEEPSPTAHAWSPRHVTYHSRTTVNDPVGVSAGRIPCDVLGVCVVVLTNVPHTCGNQQTTAGEDAFLIGQQNLSKRDQVTGVRVVLPQALGRT